MTIKKHKSLIINNLSKIRFDNFYHIVTIGWLHREHRN
jgi:hypothetical protein